MLLIIPLYAPPTHSGNITYKMATKIQSRTNCTFGRLGWLRAISLFSVISCPLVSSDSFSTVLAASFTKW